MLICSIALQFHKAFIGQLLPDRRFNACQDRFMLIGY